jgi:hypothetical protein
MDTTNASRNKLKRAKKRVRFELEPPEQSQYDDTTTSTNECGVGSSSSIRTTACFTTTTSGVTTADTLRPVKRRIIDWYPLCSEISQEEKHVRWLQPLEHDAIRVARTAEAAAFRLYDDLQQQQQQQHQHKDNTNTTPTTPSLTFTATYAHIYAICCQSDQYPNNSTNKTTDRSSPPPSSLLLLHHLLLFLSTRPDNARGLEDCTLPWLALERRMIRTQSIRAIIACSQQQQQQQQNQNQNQQTQPHTKKSPNNNNHTDAVRVLARELSRPSRRLGQALAVADATAAMMEHGCCCFAASKRTTTNDTTIGGP